VKSSSSENSPKPHENDWIETENLKCILVEVDGIGDLGIRPARSAILWQRRPDPRPPAEPPKNG
jgi:hypothetical protein